MPAPLMKVVIEKSTSLRRSRVAVVASQSRSALPPVIAWMRSSGATFTQVVFKSGRWRSVLIAVTTARQRSTE